MKKTTLGLDLGPNSIGWALIEENDADESASLVDAGVRIFQEAVESKTKTPKNQLRRASRSARRLLRRRKMRREYLLSLLQGHSMAPSEAAAFERWASLLNPYELRRRALDERLTLEQIGRCLYHLCQRRGYWSNRVSERGSKKEKGEVLSGIASLKAAIEASGSRTLGEYLAKEPSQRRRFTERDMYQTEFKAIWASQALFHPEVLTPDLRAKIFKVIFHQRPLWGQAIRRRDAEGKLLQPPARRKFIGKCTFEPSRKRAPKASPTSQLVRILQELNHLEIRNPITREWRRLTTEERSVLFRRLQSHKSLTWDAARKLLGLNSGETFNLEWGKRKKLDGNKTACDIREIIGAAWDGLGHSGQEQLVVDLLTITGEEGCLRRLKKHYGLDQDAAQKMAELELEKGVARLSIKAMRKILPHLEEGLRYDEACAAAGYVHSNPNTILHRLPRLPAPANIRNPVVEKALWEARRVINEIIVAFGRPSVIRLEMARDMKETKRQREETNKRNRAREKDNERINDLLRRNLGIAQPSRADRIKYQLWEECGGICVYSGLPISERMLFSGEVDVEHILPYSLSLDDSMMNKTLCIAKENREVKRNRSPYEAYSGNPERYNEILLRVRKLPKPKQSKFEQKEIETDEFVARQLTDLRYICVEVKDYLQQIGTPVEVSKGAATADIRRLWGLNTLLAPEGEGEKNRADHRHHAIDAIVIALTSRSLFMKLSRLSQTNYMGLSPSERGFSIPAPWPNFRRDIEDHLRRMVISHSVNHKISGALHEETAYGMTSLPAAKGRRMLVVRKRLSAFDKMKQIEDVRDAGVRGLILARLEECGGDFKRAFNDPERPLLHKDGRTPIQSVRVLVPMRERGLMGIPDEGGQPYKFFALGSNHHVEIIENIRTGRREGRFVSTLEAARRARIAKEPVVKRDHGPEWRFIAALHINDMVEIEGKIYRVQKMSDPSITFRLHTAATLDDSEEGFRRSVNTPMKFLEINALGKIIAINGVRNGQAPRRDRESGEPAPAARPTDGESRGKTGDLFTD